MIATHVVINLIIVLCGFTTSTCILRHSEETTSCGRLFLQIILFCGIFFVHYFLLLWNLNFWKFLEYLEAERIMTKTAAKIFICSVPNWGAARGFAKLCENEVSWWFFCILFCYFFCSLAQLKKQKQPQVQN